LFITKFTIKRQRYERTRLLDVLGEWRSLNVVVVNGDRNRVLTSALERVLGVVQTIVAILKFTMNFILSWSGNIYFDGSSSNCHRLVTLVAGEHDKRVGINSRVSGPGARGNVNVESRSFDWNIIKGHGNVMNSSVLGLVSNVVSSITIVNDLGFNRTIWTLDVNIKVVTSFLSFVSVFVTGFNGEGSWVGVEESRFETRTICDTVGGICSRIDFNINRGVLEVVVEERLSWIPEYDVNVVVSRISWLVLTSVGTVVVVLNVSRNHVMVRILDEDIEVVTSLGFWLSVWKNGVNGEHARVSALVSRLKTRTFGV